MAEKKTTKSRKTGAPTTPTTERTAQVRQAFDFAKRFQHRGRGRKGGISTGIASVFRRGA